MEGRQIISVMPIINEAIESILKSNDNGIQSKLDIKKANNHMYLSFLLQSCRKWVFVINGLVRLNGAFPQQASL